MRKLSLKPPERTVALQAAWEDQSAADLGPCGRSAQSSESRHLAPGPEFTPCGSVFQGVSPISTGVCATTWVCRTERRSSGSVPDLHSSAAA